jgi:hypothetical protein
MKAIVEWLIGSAERVKDIHDGSAGLAEDIDTNDLTVQLTVQSFRSRGSTLTNAQTALSFTCTSLDLKKEQVAYTFSGNSNLSRRFRSLRAC